MQQSTIVAPAWTVGLDVGDRQTHVCVLDQAGHIVERGRVATTVEALARWAARPAARTVLEAGTHSPWMSRVLGAAGHEVVVAQARQVRLIYEGHRKSDRVDAETLARLGRLDPALLAPIQHRGVAAQQHLALVRTRDAVVRTRTLLVNAVRGTVKAWGARVPACSAPQVARQTATIPAELQPALGPVLTLIATLTATIRAYDQQVEQLAQQHYPETARLRQVKGVGALTALAFVLTLEHPQRFRRSRQVGPYLGLCPKRAQSSEQDPELRISKTGDGLLRRLLVSSAHYVLGPFGPDTDLRAWGLTLARGGKRAKKRAVVAVARKLAVLLHQLWQSGAVYQSQREAPRAS
jgi:transposase